MSFVPDHWIFRACESFGTAPDKPGLWRR